MTGVVWSTRCPASWPAWARDWASTPGSLTLRLTGLNRGFRVEPVFQGGFRLSVGAALPECRGQEGRHMRQRLVRLYVGNQPAVLAQTLVQRDGPVNDWHFWRGLGSRSLGSVLFSDPLVKRGQTWFARLPLKQAWVQQLLDPQTRANLQGLGSNRTWYARCARFSRPPGRTPLWVMEVFLPQLEQYLWDC